MSYHAGVRGPGIVLVVVALAGAARADEYAGMRASGDLALDLREQDGATGDVIVGPGLRGTIGKAWIGYAAGIDLRAGGGLHGGFALDTALYPIGLTLFHGAPVSARFVIGVGTSAVTGSLPWAATFPIEGEIELHPIGALELSGWAMVTTVAGHAREGGAPDAPFGDELTIGATVRVGRHAHEDFWRWSNGWRLGATYTERLHEKRWGLVIGWGIDLAAGAMHDREPVPE